MNQNGVPTVWRLCDVLFFLALTRCAEELYRCVERLTQVSRSQPLAVDTFSTRATSSSTLVMRWGRRREYVCAHHSV